MFSITVGFTVLLVFTDEVVEHPPVINSVIRRVIRGVNWSAVEQDCDFIFCIPERSTTWKLLLHHLVATILHKKEITCFMENYNLG